MEKITTAIKSLRDSMPLEVRNRWDEEDRKRAQLGNEFRQACADCLADLAIALKHPSIARLDMEAAHRHMLRAMSIVAVLDPEEV